MGDTNHAPKKNLQTVQKHIKFSPLKVTRYAVCDDPQNQLVADLVNNNCVLLIMQVFFLNM